GGQRVVVGLAHPAVLGGEGGLAADQPVGLGRGRAAGDRRRSFGDHDRGQALWHGARDRATTGPQLAQLYARRIADLEAAARNPRRPHPIGG
ncbi:MAG TPA: hypothetical protein VHN39_14675, partial [Phenylobacterium sp.]|nr:hypothetical protein [Phenylobacterium sp.]